MRPAAAQAAEPLRVELAVPTYLLQAYWWAYVHPRAVRLFERQWLANLILFGNCARLRDAALAGLGRTRHGATLQVACVYGDLTVRLHQCLAPQASLDVVDILPIQLCNLARKLPRDDRVEMLLGNSSSLALAAASDDQVLLFFLLHEQPESVQRATLAEAMRVVKPGGRIVIVDYHRPSRWHPLRPLMHLVFRGLEPYAIDLWTQELEAFLPQAPRAVLQHKTSDFGGLYQRLVLTR